jgi:hypothetical protein
MLQPTFPSDELPMLGTVPLGPDEPELFTDAMERILRYLTDGPSSLTPALPGQQAGALCEIGRGRATWGEGSLPQGSPPQSPPAQGARARGPRRQRAHGQNTGGQAGTEN